MSGIILHHLVCVLDRLCSDNLSVISFQSPNLLVVPCAQRLLLVVVHSVSHVLKSTFPFFLPNPRSRKPDVTSSACCSSTSVNVYVVPWIPSLYKTCHHVHNAMFTSSNIPLEAYPGVEGSPMSWSRRTWARLMAPPGIHQLLG